MFAQRASSKEVAEWHTILEAQVRPLDPKKSTVLLQGVALVAGLAGVPAEATWNAYLRPIGVVIVASW